MGTADGETKNSDGGPEGEPVSLWLASAGDTNYPVLDRDVEVDVAIVGAGIAGLTAALELKRAGRTVAVIEAGRVGTGVTGNTTGKLTSLHRLAYTNLVRNHGMDTARTYGQANQAAIEHVRQVVAAERIDCGLRTVANYTYAGTEEALELVRAEAELTARLGLPASFTTDVPLPFAVKGAVRFEGQAQFHAVKYLQGLARAVQGDGSFVFEQTRALHVTDGTSGGLETKVETERGTDAGTEARTDAETKVEAEGGTVRARDIIVATNVPFGDEGIFDSKCHPHRSYVVAGRVDGPPQDATFISVDEPMRSILTVSEGGQNYVLVGGEGHRASEPGDTAGRYGRLAAFARDSLGASEIAYRWSTQDNMPVDGLPYVGLMSPAARHVYVVTGLRKWGLSNGTAAALILTDLITGRENPWAAVFNSNRTAPPAGTRASADERIKAEAADLAGKISAQRGRITLAPGEGTVIEAGGESTAVYKDPDGKVHTLSAVCTHLGCTVEFNRAATTWDCPCHGSRFAVDGTVIHGPATTRLPPGPEQIPDGLI